MQTPPPSAKVSFIGMGAMGRRHVRVMRAMPEAFAPTVAYDPLYDPLTWPEGLPRASSEAAAIDAGELIVVATPAALHATSVRSALEAGRDVFVEKPFTTDARSARALADLARAKGRRVYVGHSERFNPVVLALLASMRKHGEVPLSIALERRGPSRVDDVGVLLNFGVHDLDLAGVLTGARLRLTRATGRCEPARGLDRSCNMQLKWGDAGVCTIAVERTPERKRRWITVVTEGARYDGDLLTARLVRSCAGGHEVISTHAFKEPLVEQAYALWHARRGAKTLVADEEAGLVAVELAEEALHRVQHGSSSAQGVARSSAARGGELEIERPEFVPAF